MAKVVSKSKCNSLLKTREQVNADYVSILLQEGEREIYPKNFPFKHKYSVANLMTDFKNAGWTVEQRTYPEETPRTSAEDAAYFLFS